MHYQKTTGYQLYSHYLLLFISIFLFQSLSSYAEASSGTITASVGAGTVSISAQASFQRTHKHCDKNNKNCQTHNGGGSLSVSLDRHHLGSKSFAGESGDASFILSRATLSQGKHTASISTKDAHGGGGQSATFNIDNTPSLILNAPMGNINSGTTTIRGSVNFVGNKKNSTNQGSIRAYYNGPRF